MSKEGCTNQHKIIGRVASWTYLTLSIIYALTTVPGLISLKSPDDPISDPSFTIMGLLIVLIAPLLVVIMITVQADASAKDKAFGIIALAVRRSSLGSHDVYRPAQGTMAYIAKK